MHIEWEDRFTTGQEMIDLQHRRLIGILNDLYADIGAGRAEDALFKVFSELRRYADYHFGTEERLLRQHCVAPVRVKAHLAEHETYRRRVAELQSRHDGGERLVLVQVLAFVCDWWLQHIAVGDRDFEALAAGAGRHAANETKEDAR